MAYRDRAVMRVTSRSVRSLVAMCASSRFAARHSAAALRGLAVRGEGQVQHTKYRKVLCNNRLLLYEPAGTATCYWASAGIDDAGWREVCLFVGERGQPAREASRRTTLATGRVHDPRAGVRMLRTSLPDRPAGRTVPGRLPAAGVLRPDCGRRRRRRCMAADRGPLPERRPGWRGSTRTPETASRSRRWY